MKVQKGIVKSEMIKENEVGYLYKSVTGYDYSTDTVDFVVTKHDGETVGRYDSFVEAEINYNKL